jgi:2-keto-3-deoxy-6-phosphogluconate aldolase
MRDGHRSFTALDAGAQALKIFPSSAFGPDYIKALKAVLPASVPVFAVGGNARKPGAVDESRLCGAGWAAIFIAPDSP